MGADLSRAVVVRRRTAWSLIAVLSLCVLALSAGVGPSLSSDTWALIILAGPALSVMLVAVVTPAPAMPSSALFARPGEPRGERQVWRWFVAPYAVPLLTPAFLAASEYAGALLSQRRTPPRGLGPLLFSGADLGGAMPFAGLLFGVLIGWVGIALVVVPLKVAAQVPGHWHSNRTEALRLLAHVGLVVGLWLTIVANGLASWSDIGEDGSRLSVLRDEVVLLMGAKPDVSLWVRLMAWVGIVCLVAAGVTVWQTGRRTKD